jgi:hypothetical protein
MTAKSDYLAAALVGHVFGKSTYTPPAHYYLCLLTLTAIPSDTGSTISEVAYTNYTRLLFNTGDLNAVSGQTESNATDMSFPQCGATGDTALAWAICDAASGGNLLYYGLLPAAVPIANGQAPTVAAATLTVTEG